MASIAEEVAVTPRDPLGDPQGPADAPGVRPAARGDDRCRSLGDWVGFIAVTAIVATIGGGTPAARRRRRA